MIKNMIYIYMYTYYIYDIYIMYDILICLYTHDLLA